MTIAVAVQTLGVGAWDIYLTLLNLVSPSRKVGHVTPAGHPGFDGKWPEWVSPKEGDSRCSCPALNAMANHGILPHDGKNISFKELNTKVRATYNFAPTFCFFVPDFAARMLGKSYKTDTFDLKDIDLHNATGIEHDASLFRRDRYFEPDQSVIHMPYVNECLAFATGKDKDGKPLMTKADLSRISSKRRAEARVAGNPDFELNKLHRTFGSSNSSTLLTIFGGRVEDLEVFLKKEQLPDKWESRIRKPHGLTITTFNLKTVQAVERGIDESKFTPVAKPETATATETSPQEAS